TQDKVLKHKVSTFQHKWLCNGCTDTEIEIEMTEQSLDLISRFAKMLSPSCSPTYVDKLNVMSLEENAQFSISRISILYVTSVNNRDNEGGKPESSTLGRRNSQSGGHERDQRGSGRHSKSPPAAKRKSRSHYRNNNNSKTNNFKKLRFGKRVENENDGDAMADNNALDHESEDLGDVEGEGGDAFGVKKKKRNYYNRGDRDRNRERDRDRRNRRGGDSGNSVDDDSSTNSKEHMLTQIKKKFDIRLHSGYRQQLLEKKMEKEKVGKDPIVLNREEAKQVYLSTKVLNAQQEYVSKQNEQVRKYREQTQLLSVKDRIARQKQIMLFKKQMQIASTLPSSMSTVSLSIPTSSATTTFPVSLEASTTAVSANAFAASSFYPPNVTPINTGI
ncbi:cwfJ family protein, partial [Reticulomyxa filosa]